LPCPSPEAVFNAFDAEDAEPDLSAFEIARVEEGGTKRVGSDVINFVALRRWIK